MKAQPYNFVLMPHFKGMDPLACLLLAEGLSRMLSSQIYFTKIFDFSYEWKIFLNDDTFSKEDRCISFFIEHYWCKLFQAGYMTFVVNFNFEHLGDIVNELSVQRSGLKALIFFTQSQSDDFNSEDYYHLDIDRCIYGKGVTKTMMQMLGITGESH